MRDPQAKKFDAVLVARFDRFARSVKHLVLALEQLRAISELPSFPYRKQ
jgi:DNA invertase Pin-like site-specific DNA recombinase